MIESADWLCEKHFGKNLIDEQVEILDPAAGTGTFICELIEHFRGQPAKLKHKYQEELHANEVAILPYYVANLNIEATYAAVTGDYLEYPNLCFVDTLDNTYALQKHHGHMDDLFGSVSDDNVKRIRRQNSRKISVIIGNPPYNANQMNENNKNREYKEIDKRIKDTYIAASTAQKTKLYDMYARFFRWASDRLDQNGILAFITNRSFIESRTFDGFRAVVEKEFNEIWVVDLGGDVRANPKLSGTKHNVFGIQTGVAISFMVKRAKTKGCRILYARRPELETAEEKIVFLGGAKLGSIALEEVRPEKSHRWINLAENDFNSLIPIALKEAKTATSRAHEKAIFKLYSLGVSTNRDEWVIDASSSSLADKLKFLVKHYESRLGNGEVDEVIKWSETLRRRCGSRAREPFSSELIAPTLYRPFVERFGYHSKVFVDRPGLATQLFPPDRVNSAIGFMAGDRQPFSVVAAKAVPNLNMFSADAVQYATLHRYNDEGVVADNITDWALKQFEKHQRQGKGKKDRPITKGAIFHYVYAVLHDPIYREKYALNLKREFPRIPFYADFWQWSDWGKTLMDLDIGYEAVAPFALTRTDLPDEKARAAKQAPKAMLKADKEAGCIVLDSETTLRGVPAAAWQYRLGNRSALEWILDQYKEKKAKDPTIREHFDTYRFADYKEKVADLLARVATVSVQTVAIVEAMRRTAR